MSCSFSACTNLNFLEKSDNDGKRHEEVDDGVRDVDDEDGDEVEVLLVDERKVEDEGDGESDQCKETQEQPDSRGRPVQPLAVPLLLSLALPNHDKGGSPPNILPHVVQDVGPYHGVLDDEWKEVDGAALNGIAEDVHLLARVARQ